MGERKERMTERGRQRMIERGRERKERGRDTETERRSSELGIKLSKQNHNVFSTGSNTKYCTQFPLRPSILPTFTLTARVNT